MFFDLILLNPQHRGQFGKAWLAGTLGIKKLTKNDIEELDIVKLCDNIMKYMASTSNSPQKRFSLRLSSILLGGASRIIKEKTIILYNDACRINVYIPVITRDKYDKDFNAPPPNLIPKVRRKKTKKQDVVVETPPVVFEESEPLRNLNIEDILMTQPTAEITMKEALPVPTNIETMDELGVGCPAEWEHIFKENAERRSSSCSVAGPVIIQVNAEIHAEKGESIERHEMTTAKDIPQETQQITVADVSRVLREIQLPRQRDAIVSPRSIIEAPIPIPVQDDKIIEVTEKDAAVAGAARVRSSSSVHTERQELNRTKKRINKEKLFLVRPTRRFISINRCADGGGRFVSEPPGLKGTFENSDSAYLYKRFGMTVGVGSPSLETRPQVPASKSSSIPSTSDIRRTLGIGGVRETTRSTQGADIQRAVDEPTKTGRPERTTSSMQATDVPKTSYVPMEVEVCEAIVPELQQQPTLAPENADVPILITGRDKTVKRAAAGDKTAKQTKAAGDKTVERTEAAGDKTVERTEAAGDETPKVDDSSVRQQKIVNILMAWNFDERFPTIENVAEKPISRKSIATAFHDLLVLCGAKYVVLVPEENSFELNYIMKGPKMQN